jgi:spermidine/putrescine transport system permease protein
MILPLINNLKDLPQNLLEASSDLGRKSFHTLFKVIIP